MEQPIARRESSSPTGSKVSTYWSCPVKCVDRVAERKAMNEQLGRWGFSDTRFRAFVADGEGTVKMSSDRYGLGKRPAAALWSFVRDELGLPLKVSQQVADPPLPQVAQPAVGVLEALQSVVVAANVSVDPSCRIDCGTGQGLADVWRLRSGMSIACARRSRVS